ncbi:MAG: M61 family metallopeptidase [Ignavibacteriales bacterium]|nr:M61 family metallopeptidase [Ignavibacteriales bacterium]
MTHSQPAVHYTLAMSHPSTHLLEVEIRVDDLKSNTVDLHMPAWRTGRYVIFDFSGGVQEFSAVDDKGKSIQWKKMDKDTWRIEHGGANYITARYKVYANEFNQRTRELNSEHAFIDPAAVFMYVDELKNRPLELSILPYGTWHVTTGLDEVEGKKFTYGAPSFEYFADCPIEIGNQKDFRFTVDNKPHIISIYGDGNWNIDTLITDFTKIVVANKEFWGDLPYKKYIFFIHCQPNAGGGTEHINSTVMGVRPFIFSNRASYIGFLGLVSHEYFHTWNVKQLRPKAYAPYDFSKEGYSEELWISEGTTSYFDDLIVLRAGYRDAKNYLEMIGQMISSDRSRYGNTIQPLSEASFDAWVKYWKRQQNSFKAESDYYGKGSHVSLLLDLEIRHRSENKHSLDDVMRTMYRRFPVSKGFTNADFIKVSEEFTGGRLKEFFDNYLYGTVPLPWEKNLAFTGLELALKDSTGKIGLGIMTQDTGEKNRITGVIPNSPAEKAGVEINDEIVALNGFRVRSSEMNERVSSMTKGDEITLTIFRNDKLKEIKLQLEYFGFPAYVVKKTAKPTDLQKSIFESWLKDRF